MEQQTRAILAVAAGAAMACAVDGFMVEPYRVQTRHLQLAFTGLPEGLEGMRIAQMSDLHMHAYGRVYRRLLTAVQGEKPDLIVITGDLVDRSDATLACQTFIRDLCRASGAPVFAVPGNWDHRAFSTQQAMKVWKERLSDAGAHVLVNQNVRITRRGAVLWLTGTDDPYFGHADLKKSFQGIPSSGFAVVLTHAPEAFEELAQVPSARLVLAGHTHGGQVRLPIIGALHVPSRFGTRFSWGLYRIQDTLFYVNPGIGMSHLPVRFLCTPELTMITLRAAGSGQNIAASVSS